MRVTLPSGTAAELVSIAGARRGVVVCPDMIGLRPLFVDLVHHLADAYGWATCAVEPFAGREGEPVEERLRSPMPTGLTDDLVAAADLLGTPAVGLLGFCFGGMAVLQATAQPRFDRVAAFYGMLRVPEAWAAPDVADPVDVLAGTDTAVLALFGGVDPWTPPAAIDELRRRAPAVEVVVYPDADHAFAHDPERATHRPGDAADAWGRVVGFFES